MIRRGTTARCYKFTTSVKEICNRKFPELSNYNIAQMLKSNKPGIR